MANFKQPYKPPQDPLLDEDLEAKLARMEMSTGEKARRVFANAGMNIGNLPGAAAQLGALGLIATPAASFDDLYDLDTLTGNLWAYGESSLDAAGNLFNIDPATITPAEDILGALVAAPVQVGGAAAATGNRIAQAAAPIAKVSAIEAGLDIGITEAARGLMKDDYLTPAGAAGERLREGIDAIVEEQEAKGTLELKRPAEGEKPNLTLAGADLESLTEEELNAELDAIEGREMLRQEMGGDPYADTPFSTAEKVALGVTAALAALGGASTLVRFTRVSPRGETVNLGSNPESGLENLTTVGETALIKAIDPNAAIASQIKKTAGADEAEDFASAAAQNTRLGAATRTVHGLDTGELPNSGIRITPIRRMQEAFAALDDTNRRVFHEGMFAIDELDQRRISRYQGTGDNTVSHTRPGAPDYSDQQLQDMVRLMRRVPELKKFENEYRNNTRGLLRYMYQQGLISMEKYDYLRDVHPHYMPRIKDPFDGETSKLKRTITSWQETVRALTGRDSPESKIVRDTEHLIERNVEQGTGLSNTLNPITALEYYASGVMLIAQKNKAKLRAIDTLAGSSTYQKSLRQVRPPTDQRSGSNYPAARNEEAVVSVLRDGRREYWEFADPQMARAVGFVPHEMPGLTTGVLAAMRRTFQMGTTGLLQPFFAVKSLLWDAPMAAAFRKPGYSFGMIDGWLQTQRVLGRQLALPGDPTAYISSLLGVGRDIAAKMQRQIVVGIERSLVDSAPSIWKAMPEATRRHVANAMWQQYIKSTRAIMQREGVMNVGFMIDPATSYNSLLQKMTPLFNDQARIPVLHQLLEGYKGLIDSMHNGTRVQFFAQNYRPDMTPKELSRLSLETRQLTGDFSASGIGDTYRAWSEALPYSNVTVQATRRVADSLYSTLKQGDPTVLLGVVTATSPYIAGAYLASTLGEEYWDYYWNVMPAWERSTNVYLPIPGLPPEEGLKIPVPPELQVFAQLGMAGVDAALGLSSGQIASDDFADLKEAVGQYFGLILPPGVNAMLAATGNRFDMGEMLAGNPEDALKPLRTSGLAGFDQNARVPGSEIGVNVAEMMNSLFGTTARFFIEGYQTVEQGEKRDLSLTENAENVLDNFVQQGRRRVPIGRPIWGGDAFSIMNEANRELSRKLDVIDKLGPQLGIERFGTPTAQGKPLTNPFVEKPPKATNEAFIEVLPHVHGLLNDPVLRELVSQRKFAKNNIDGLAANLVMNPQARQREINRYTKEYQALTTNILDKIRRIEAAGGFKLEELDPFAKN